MVGAELLADLEPVVARAGQDHRLRANRLGHGHADQADGARAGHDHAFARDKAAKFGEPIHRGARRDDQRGLFVRHVVVDMHQRVDVVHLVFAEAAIGGETIGPVALVDVTVVLAVIVARGVHALAAALALAATGMDLHRHPLADLVFVDAGAERHDGSHVFMAGGEVLVERQFAA